MRSEGCQAPIVGIVDPGQPVGFAVGVVEGILGPAVGDHEDHQQHDQEDDHEDGTADRRPEHRPEDSASHDRKPEQPDPGRDLPHHLAELVATQLIGMGDRGGTRGAGARHRPGSLPGFWRRYIFGRCLLRSLFFLFAH